MKTYTRRYLGLFIIIAFTAMPGWGAVPKDGEVWIRIRCELPWELINNRLYR